MVGNSRRGASVFGTTARIPTFLSFEFNLGVAYIEYNTIGTEGSSWEISLAACYGSVRWKSKSGGQVIRTLLARRPAAERAADGRRCRLTGLLNFLKLAVWSDDRIVRNGSHSQLL
jgi:hypothetical protein